MYEILIIVFLIVALAIIGLVLIQKGKGADMGASFGAGASATLFGSTGTGNFLTKTTTILGILFFIISIALANLGSKKGTNDTFYNLEDDSTITAVQQTEVQQSSGDQTPVTGFEDSTFKNTAIEQEQINSISDIPE